MSLRRLMYYSAVIGGWAAFLGWMLAEIAVWAMDVRHGSYLELALFAGLVGAAIGAGLNVVAGMTNIQWQQLAKRVGLGMLGGGAGGVVGGVIGNSLYVGVVWLTTQIGFPEFLVNGIGLVLLVLGWTILGVGVGAVDGLFSGSMRKLRQGVVGGAVGGFMGGILFEPIAHIVATEMSSRATGFVVLGICIGLLIGLVHVALKEAWLMVKDGYGPSRELVLDREIEAIGRGDHLRLPFRGAENKDLEAEHFQIARRDGSNFYLEYSGGSGGVQVRSVGGAYEPLSGSRHLRDGDLIKFCNNLVEFKERRKAASDPNAPVESQQAKPARPVKATPPPPKPTLPKGKVKQQERRATPAAETPAAPTENPSAAHAPSAQPSPAPAPKLKPPPPPPRKR